MQHIITIAGLLLVSLALDAKADDTTSPVAQVALQVALDRHGFGVGLIDNKRGAKTDAALADFKASAGATNEAAWRKVLGIDKLKTFRNYIVAQEDFDLIGDAPNDWVKASKVPRMACVSLPEVLSEKFHVAEDYLLVLNPGISDWRSTNVMGTSIMVPNILLRETPPLATRLVVDCRQFRLRAFDAERHLIASFPCSMAMEGKPIPAGTLKIATCAQHPIYTFDPKNYPESPRAKAINQKLIIPAGPNNPVGIFWIGMNLAGFGIHGTPHPETIGTRESHGCFRLTNWDILRLSKMIGSGTPVEVIGLDEQPGTTITQVTPRYFVAVARARSSSMTNSR